MYVLWMSAIRKIFLASMLCGSPLAAAELTITLRDGNPLDILSIRNNGCPVSDGTLIFDFTTSQADVFLDTVRGGPGSRDPLAVKVMNGDIAVHPVADGAQILTIDVRTLNEGSIAQVSMDMDDGLGTRGTAQVEVYGSELKGAVATLITGDTRHMGIFDANGIARIGGYDEDGCGVMLIS